MNYIAIYLLGTLLQTFNQKYEQIVSPINETKSSRLKVVSGGFK